MVAAGETKKYSISPLYFTLWNWRFTKQMCSIVFFRYFASLINLYFVEGTTATRLDLDDYLKYMWTFQTILFPGNIDVQEKSN